MGQTAVSLRYIEALVGAAEERGVLDRVEEDAQGLLELIRASEDLRVFLADALIRAEQKKTLFRTLFSGKIQELTLNFLLLLCDKGRERILADILKGFLTFLNDRRGIMTAQVRSAVAFSPEQEAQLKARLSAYSGKQVQLETEVDTDLKAGFVARLGDQVFDGTLETQLKQLRQRLAAGS